MGLGWRRDHASMGLADDGLGIFFTVVVGGGLMILLFYSSRAGYDEPPHIDYDENETQRGSARRPRRHKRQRNKVTRTH